MNHKMRLTKTTTPTKMTAPHSEVEFRSSFFSIGDNSPQSNAVFLCLPLLDLLHKFVKQVNSIMTALFGQPLRLVAPMRDTANPLNAVTRFFAVLRDGFTTLSIGITA